MSTHQQDVLQEYLDTLLEGAPQVLPEAETAPLSLPQTAPDDAEVRKQQLQRLLHSARLQVEQVVDAPETKPAAPASSADRIAEPEITSPVQEMDADLAVLHSLLEWHSNGRPLWAQQKFEVLLFKVSGLTLAVPLIALGQIQPLTGELTPLFGQADWFMGVLPTLGGKIYTLNTARFVMPERYDPAFEKTARYVVSINGVPWGLAVDTVEQPITLSPDDVKWRTARTQRPWLAGTVKAQMCALLDIPMMGKLLMDSDKNARHRRGGV